MYAIPIHEIMFRVYYYTALFVICFSLASLSAFAARTVNEAFIAQEDAKKVFTSEFPGGQFGSALVRGDFNGDGADDLAISAPIASPKDKKWSGVVRVIFGRTYKVVTYHGENSGDQLGRSLAVGDFNGDGMDDLAIGAHNAYVAGENPGKAYLLYGGNIEGNSRDFANENADRELTGIVNNSAFALTLAAGDINHDGIDDLLVGAPLSTRLRNINAGAVYLYAGSSGKVSESYDSVFYGQVADERFGSEIKTGDFNGDGHLDLVVGAYKADSVSTNQAGKVYFYDGSDELGDVIFSPDAVFNGNSNGEWFGFSLAVGDLNGDLIDDLAISSFPYWSDRNMSQVLIYYGGADFSQKKPNIIINEAEKQNILASDVLLRDFNSDGRADILIGAPGVGQSANGYEGAVYMIESSDKKFNPLYRVQSRDLDTYIYGQQVDDWFGNAIEVLDFNNDGYMDLAVGAMYADTDLGTDNGEVVILWGGKTAFGKKKDISEMNGQEVSRAEFVREVLAKFELRDKKKTELENCYQYREFCLFNFMSMSSYSKIELEPQLVLYPDVRLGDEYYDDITVATLLGLVNGYIDVQDSPFNKDLAISRVQALKVVMGAADILESKYRFELVASLGSYDNLTQQRSYFSDVDPRVDHMWWYPRYVNFAVDLGLIDEGEFFRPDDSITQDELDDLLDRTVEFLSAKDAKVEPSGDQGS